MDTKNINTDNINTENINEKNINEENINMNTKYINEEIQEKYIEKGIITFDNILQILCNFYKSSEIDDHIFITLIKELDYNNFVYLSDTAIACMNNQQFMIRKPWIDNILNVLNNLQINTLQDETFYIKLYKIISFVEILYEHNKQYKSFLSDNY